MAADPMDNIIPVPLDLPDIRILSAEKTREGAWLVRIESTLTSTKCSRCGQETSDFHGLDHLFALSPSTNRSRCQLS
ncbi:MAG TPA: hypothetical protein VE842_04155 [Pyrinomonadaceae bacterium]|jgi:hypothetical protein|nr:hypothetical protein [Pyrinomonadaceae bacterium]